MMTHIFLRQTVRFGGFQDSVALIFAQPRAASFSQFPGVGRRLHRVLVRMRGSARRHTGRRASSTRYTFGTVLSIAFGWYLVLRALCPPEKVSPQSVCEMDWCNPDLRIFEACGYS